ncbi:hypothetical protein FQR65_LT07686 [Abscondita terminalis]|nr:hypothetical protein FQR65_LT07686 [Abscondita terminalis]
MGTTLSAGDRVEPKNLNDGTSTNVKQFGLSGRRYTTDVVFLLLHSLFFTLLIPLLIYCVHHGDISRIIHGYDNCLNICGKNNPASNTKDKVTCTAKNMSSQPFIMVYRSNARSNLQTLLNETEDNKSRTSHPLSNDTIVERVCLANCSIFPNYRSFINKCVITNAKNAMDSFLGKTGLDDFFQEVSEDFELCWPEILYLCIISLVFSLVIMILFRLLVGIVVWLVLVGVVLACSLGTAYLWILWRQSKMDSNDATHVIGTVEVRKTDSYLAFAIIASIVTVCVLLIVLVLRKRVQLVIQLFKEAGKAIGSMPLVLFQPIWTFACIAIAIASWIYFTLWIESSGHQKMIREDHYIFEKDAWMIFTRWYNIFITLWLLQFFIGCQHMVIAGAIASWYFTRNKSLVKSPVFYGFYNLTRYHIGSVSFGSLIIALVQIARMFLKVLETYLKTHEGNCVNCLVKCCQCCLCCFEKILKYLTRNAYIEIAIHGYNFCQAGKQAFKTLTSNALRVATINSVGDFVLFLGKLLVVVATVLIGVELIQKKDGIIHSWVPLTLAGLFAYFISHCFLSVYEMAIDSIFICFCEDCEENDGLGKPYYMSRDLMDFVENSNKSVLRSTNVEQAWQEKPTTVS